MKRVTGEGVEKDSEMLARCIERGLVVHQGDVLDGLDQHDSNSFDYVLLMGTLQELVTPGRVIEEAFRVGRYVIIGYINFAYWKIRFQLMFGGRTPITEALPHRWYQSPNLHVCSIYDFRDFCKDMNIIEVKSAFYGPSGRIIFQPNLFAEESVALLEKKG
jgi:methionine biosynthesis protein MetW